MSKAKAERRRARALARPLELSRLGGRRERPEVAERLKRERQSGTNVPARVVERMGGSTKGVRVSEGDTGPRLRPTRKPRTAGSEAMAAGLTGKGYASRGDGIKRLTDDEIRARRDAWFKQAEYRRNERAAAVVARPVPPGRDMVAEARESYAYAIGQANRLRAAGDMPGAEVWMGKARKFRRLFRNK
jgi:hypothetical protein